MRDPHGNHQFTGHPEQVTAQTKSQSSGPSSPAVVPGSPSFVQAVYRTAPRYALLLGLLLTIAVFGVLRPDSFFTLDNAKSILNQAAPLMVVAVGLTIVLTMQLLDLSFAAAIGLCGSIAIVLMSENGMGWELAVLVA